MKGEAFVFITLRSGKKEEGIALDHREQSDYVWTAREEKKLSASVLPR